MRWGWLILMTTLLFAPAGAAGASPYVGQAPAATLISANADGADDCCPDDAPRHGQAGCDTSCATCQPGIAPAAAFVSHITRTPAGYQPMAARSTPYNAASPDPPPPRAPGIIQTTFSI